MIIHACATVCMYACLFSCIVEATATDPSPILTERQCIEVSINSFCNESADSFQVQIQYFEGNCERNVTIFILTDNYTLNESYSQCVPINMAGTVCYRARVFHNFEVVGVTKAQQLTLLPCDTNSLNVLRGSGVIISNLYMGQEEVHHNTVVKFGCNSYELNQTRCINGTFQPVVTSDIHITCSGGEYLF